VDETNESQTPGQQAETLLRANYPRALSCFHHRPLLAAITYTVVLIATGISNAFAFGHFTSTASVTGLTEDSVFWLGVFVLGIALYYYLMLPVWLGQAFDLLYAEHVFAASEVKVDPHTKHLFGSRRLSWLAYGATLIGATLWTTTALISPEKMWWESNPISFISLTLVEIVAWFALAGVVVNFVLSGYLIHKILHNNHIVVHPLHPDRCGGWSSLGKFSLRVSYFALVYGVLLVIWAIGAIQSDISDDYALFIQVFAYVVAVPTLFYLPLHSAHKSMVAFRNKLIRDTSDRYLQEHLRAHDMEVKDVEVLQTSVKYMDTLRDLQKHELTYPVWPFSIRTRLAVLLNAVTPAIPTIFGVIIDRVI